MEDLAGLTVVVELGKAFTDLLEGVSVGFRER